MKKTVIAAAAAALMTVIGVGSTYAQDALQPSKVTGGGVYQQFEGWESMEADGLFAMNIDPGLESRSRLRQAVILVDGCELRKFWGEPLFISDKIDLDAVAFLDFGLDSKPGQMFRFVLRCPANHQRVVVYVMAHDNVTPGYNSEVPQWSDWFYVFIEDLKSGDGVPFSGDELFIAGGIVVCGDIIDYRQ